MAPEVPPDFPERAPERLYRLQSGCLTVVLDPSTWDTHVAVPPDASRPPNFVDLWHAEAPLHLRTLLSGGLPLHAALVVRDGWGVLLTAPGGTGKSTAAARLIPEWQVWGDDQALVFPDSSAQYRAHPLPTWSNLGYGRPPQRWEVFRHIPLAAVFFLFQHPQNEIFPIGRGTAAVWLNQSVTQMCRRWWIRHAPEPLRNERQIAFRAAADMARRLPMFGLRVSLNGELKRVIESALAGLNRRTISTGRTLKGHPAQAPFSRIT